MKETTKQVNLARRRLNISLFLDTFLWMATIGLLAATCGMIIPKLKSLEVLLGESSWLAHWNALWIIGCLGIALLLAMIWWWPKRRSMLGAAIEVDQRFGLKERLSSAISISHDEAESRFGQALIADAEQHATRIDVPDEIDWRPRRFWLPFIPAAIMVAILFVPDARRPDPLPAVPVVNERKEIKTAIEDIRKTLEERVRQLEEKGLKDLAEELKVTAKTLDEMMGDEESVRKEALVKLNNLRRHLDEKRKELGDAQELKSELNRLKNLAQGPAEKMSQALSENDFEKAKQMALELARKLRDGELTESEQKQLADDLRKLAKEIDRMVERHEDNKQRLEQQLKEALRNGDVNKADALQRQLEQLKQQDELMDRMRQMAQKMNRGAEQCEKGNSGARRAARDGQKPGAPLEHAQKQASEALEDLAELMDQLDVSQSMVEALQDLENELQDCKGALAGGNGNLPGADLKNKPEWNDFAMGGGIGGGKRALQENETSSFKMRVKGQLQKGETVVTGDADGENLTGKSPIEAKQLIQSQLSKESDPLEDQRLPRALRDHAKEYFERLREGK